MSREAHRQRFSVHSYEVDHAERLSLRSLCAFLQEAAGQDAARLGVSMGRLIDQQLAWVLQRLKLEVLERPRRCEDIDVSTWAKRFERVVAHRDFEVHDERGALIAAATSRWVVVDLGQRRVVRLPDFIRQLPVAARPAALEMDSSELPDVAAAEVEKRFEVRRSDLDVVRHVNNTRYIEWALETVPDDVFEAQRPTALEIVFRRESVYGDSVVSQARRLALDGGPAFAHRLAAAQGGQALAQAISRWRPVET